MVFYIERRHFGIVLSCCYYNPVLYVFLNILRRCKFPAQSHMYKLHHYSDVVDVAGYLLAVHYWVLSVSLE